MRIELHFLKLKFTGRKIYGTQLIQNNVSVKLKTNCKFKMYKTRFNFKLKFHHVHVDCFEHKDLSAHICSHYLSFTSMSFYCDKLDYEENIELQSKIYRLVTMEISQQTRISERPRCYLLSFNITAPEQE